MLTTIKNNTISITADTKGAELYSMEASNGISYLWKGDSAFWKGRAPILFPIVGALRGGRAKSKEGDILLPRHGFARSAEWALESNDEQSLTYRLCSTAETKAVYPYDFEIRVRYIIGDNTVTTAISVHNTGDTTMPFCVGGHPGFHVPLVEGEKFENYLVEFDCPESADCPGVDLESGLILDRSRRRFLAEQTTFRLDHELFRNDALVFDQLKSRSVRLISEKSGHGVRMDFAGLDFFAVWTPVTDSPFVCLEPWTGTATQESEDDVFEHKQGIRLLAPGGEDAVSFTVTVFESMKKVWDAIVFDLDGTLADTLRDLAEATNVALVENGFSSWPLDHYRIMVGNGLRKLIERATGGAPSPVVDRVMADFVRIYDRDCLRFTRAYDDMPETLAALRAAGTRLLVVTNKPDAQAQKIVAHLYGVGLFDGVFGNREGRKTKPDPCLTLESLSSVNVLPARSLFVGDSDVDIYTAKSAGMKSAGVTWGFREVEELGAAGADFILYNPTEILNTY